MKQPLIDNRQNPIAVDCKVCYNLSGEISVGTVISCVNAIADSNNWVVKKAKIKIRNAITGKISEVTNPKNVMVIYENTF